MDIAAFILFGDVELSEACARELLKKVPEFDYIVTPEAKSIPLAYEMSKQSGKKYIVARKGVKVYMQEPVKVTVTSITTQKEQTLYLGHEDGDLLKGKRVLIVDDVISTGESLKAVQELVKKFDANIVASCAPLAEGDSADRDDIIYLEKLPLFFK
jgi:adenine phosphoribosyltransferase